MNTFLPYSNFQKSAQCLDNKRLGKQRVEVWQIYNALKQGEYTYFKQLIGDKIGVQEIKEITIKRKTSWYNHPAVQMWKGYEFYLLMYGQAICQAWKDKGFKDSLLVKFNIECSNWIYAKKTQTKPYWLGNEKFHSAMRSNLLRKNKEWYSQFGWTEPDNLPYYWPTKEKEKEI